MKKFLLSITILACLVFTVSSCKKKKDDEGELITTLRVKLTPTGGATQTFTFKDADGAGGAPPSVFNTITLARNTTYACVLEVLDESGTAAKDMTAEIVAEANDHQFYITSTSNQLTISNLNNDSRGLPLGTTSNWTTGGIATNGAKLQIVLKHKPGIKNAGDGVAIGETDIEIPNNGFDLQIN